MELTKCRADIARLMGTSVHRPSLLLTASFTVDGEEFEPSPTAVNERQRLRQRWDRENIVPSPDVCFVHSAMTSVLYDSTQVLRCFELHTELLTANDVCRASSASVGLAKSMTEIGLSQ